MCTFFSTLIIWELHFKVQTSFEAQILCFLSPSPSILLLLPSSSYPWLPMVVSFFLTHLLLRGVSNHLSPSPFHWYQTLRSKKLNWWRRFKAYKLQMELHQLIFFLPFWSIFIHNFKCECLLQLWLRSCFWNGKSFWNIC